MQENVALKCLRFFFFFFFGNGLAILIISLLGQNLPRGFVWSHSRPSCESDVSDQSSSSQGLLVLIWMAPNKCYMTMVENIGPILLWAYVEIVVFFASFVNLFILPRVFSYFLTLYFFKGILTLCLRVYKKKKKKDLE